MEELFDMAGAVEAAFAAAGLEYPDWRSRGLSITPT
jgi:hypothetical protein